MGIPVVMEPRLPVFPVYGQLRQIVRACLDFPKGVRSFRRRCWEIHPELNTKVQQSFYWRLSLREMNRLLWGTISNLPRVMVGKRYDQAALIGGVF
jgi:hypothetical protein